MYKNSFAMAIKHNGKILRESKDLVLLPFGSEFTILLKNLNNRRAQVQVSIDGTDIGDGTTFIVGANSELELKRFVRNGNLDEGNAFKFIERTAGIEEHRGIKMDDGIVRVEFQFEREVIHNNPIYVNTWPYAYPSYPHYPGYWCTNTSYGAGAIGRLGGSTALRGMAQSAIATGANSSVSGESASINTVYTAQSIPQVTPANDAGITVPGSKVEQQFKVVTNFNAETDSHVLILRLAGETADNKPVEKAVTVKSKTKCIVCSHSNKSNCKFCSQCGTSLELF